MKIINFIILILISLFFVSCVTREQIQATIWLNNFNDSIQPICARDPELKNYGFYRKLNTGKIEFVSVCSLQAVHFVALPEKDFNNILDQALPKKSETPSALLEVDPE